LSFFQLFRPTVWHNLLCSGCHEREVDNSPLSIVNVKKTSGAIRRHLHTPSWRAQGKNLPLSSPYISFFISLYFPLLLFLSRYIFLYINFSFCLIFILSSFFFATSLYFLFIFLYLSILLCLSFSNSFSLFWGGGGILFF